MIDKKLAKNLHTIIYKRANLKFIVKMHKK